MHGISITSVTSKKAGKRNTGTSTLDLRAELVKRSMWKRVKLWNTSGDKGHNLPIEAALKSVTFINTNDGGRYATLANNLCEVATKDAELGCSRLSRPLGFGRLGFGMFLRKCSSQERKKMAEGSCHPWATGKVQGVQKQKLQYNIFMSEEFQRHHLSSKLQRRYGSENTDKSNKQFCGSTGFCPLRR